MWNMNIEQMHYIDTLHPLQLIGVLLPAAACMPCNTVLVPLVVLS